MQPTLSQALLQWLNDYPGLFSWHDIPHGLQLTEVFSKKTRQIIFAEVTQWRQKENPAGLSDYLNLVLEDGNELVLCDAGFAFAPSYAYTGELAQLPPVVCLQDFYRLEKHLGHIYEEPMSKNEAIRTLMNCLAILEGARTVGLDISEEEKSLEPMLDFLEAH